MILREFREKVRRYHIMKIQQDYSPSDSYFELDGISGVAALVLIAAFIFMVVRVYKEVGMCELTVALFIGLIVVLFYLYMIIRVNTDRVINFIKFMLKKG